MSEKLLPCPFCGGKAIIETWSSGGKMYMVKCNNPDCYHPENYPRGHNLLESIKEWNGMAKNMIGGENNGQKR